MARSKSKLKDFIQDYDDGLISDNDFVMGLTEWDYKEQGSNSSPWECDAPYVEGSWDDVMSAMYDGIIPDNIYAQINDALDERLLK